MVIRSRGFTLVELLIVIVVIAILAAISVIAYNGILNRAKVSSVNSTVSQIHKKAALFQAENGNWPGAGDIKNILDEVRGPGLSSQSYLYCRDDQGNYAVADFETFQPQANNSDLVYYASSKTGGIATITFSLTHDYYSHSICNSIFPDMTDARWYSFL